MQDRKDTFEQLKVEDKKRKKWNEVLDLQYMSSEESEDDNVLKVKPIPWLSSKVKQFKKTLDEEKEKNLNAQSKRQRKRKVTEETSERIRPDGSRSRWIFKKQKTT